MVVPVEVLLLAYTQPGPASGIDQAKSSLPSPLRSRRDAVEEVAATIPVLAAAKELPFQANECQVPVPFSPMITSRPLPSGSPAIRVSSSTPVEISGP